MKPIKQGTRVRFIDKPFLSDGYVLSAKMAYGRLAYYIIKLDKKAPNEYAWETDEILSFGSDIEEVV